jgi:hypothetical protein
MLRCSALLALLLAVLAGHGTALAGERPAVVLVAPAKGPRAPLLAAAEGALGASERYRLVLLQALVTPMQQADAREKIRERAAALVEEGRKAQLGMDYDTARQRFSAALRLLEGGFVRYYDPRVMAQLRLLLGAVALHRARPDLAREELVKALHLDPSLKPDAHYSPQVRAAFAEAAQSLPPRPEPPAADVRRIMTLAGARAAVVLGVQGLGEQSLLKAALLGGEKEAYTSLESVLVRPADAKELARRSRGLGELMRARVEALLPKPPPPATQPLVENGGRKKNGKRPPPPPPPWYLRWYTLVAAGVAVTAAIVLPLALTEEQATVNVDWKPPKPANAK